MILYIIVALSALIFLFLITLCVQLLRIERSVTNISLFVEEKVTKLYHPGEKHY